MSQLEGCLRHRGYVVGDFPCLDVEHAGISSAIRQTLHFSARGPLKQQFSARQNDGY